MENIHSTGAWEADADGRLTPTAFDKTAYTDIAAHVAQVLAKKELAGKTRLCVDATGLGTPFCDVLTEGGIDHLAITMTAGASWNRRRGHRVTVSKNLLLETLASGFETGALTIAHDLPLRAELTAEIASFELATTQAGNLVLQGGGRGHHADMAVALALAWFASERLVRWSGAGGEVGELVLRGGIQTGSKPGNACLFTLPTSHIYTAHNPD